MKCLASLVIVVATGCGSSSKPVSEPAKPLVWKDMDATQRQKYMTDVVLPRTKALFVEFDPKYQSMDCKTCHGDGATDGSFEMPNAKIKPLPNTPEAFMAWMSKDAEAARYAQFMGTKLEPAMGELLQQPVFDPKTGQGEVSCSTCHTLVDVATTRRSPYHRCDHQPPGWVSWIQNTCGARDRRSGSSLSDPRPER